MFTMSPEPCSTMPSTAAWVMYSRPSTLVETIRRQSSGSAPTIVPSSMTPALLTRTSRPPSSARVRATASRQACSSVTSRSRASTRAPSPVSFPARASRRSRRRASIATAAPASARARAVASPMPDDAPVTSATLPARGRAASVMRCSCPEGAERETLVPGRRRVGRQPHAEAVQGQPQQHRPRLQQVGDPLAAGHLEVGDPALEAGGALVPGPVQHRGVGPHLPAGLLEEAPRGLPVDRRGGPVEDRPPAAGLLQLGVLGRHPLGQDAVDALVVAPPAGQQL